MRLDRMVEVNLGANLPIDLALVSPGTTVVAYASSGQDPTLPVRACMAANLTLRSTGCPLTRCIPSARTITAALDDGALSELPVHHFALDDIVLAHEAVEDGVIGKVLIDGD